MNRLLNSNAKMQTTRIHSLSNQLAGGFITSLYSTVSTIFSAKTIAVTYLSRSLIIGMLLMIAGMSVATNYYSGGNLAPNLTSSWWTNNDGTGTHPTNFTSAGNTFIIQAAHTMTTTATWTVSGTGSAVQVNGVIVASYPVNAPSLTFYIGSTYQHAQNGGSIPTATWNSGSLLKVTGITNTIVKLPTTIGGNVEWNCPNQTVNGANADIYTSVQNGATFTIGGNLTVTNTGIGTISLFNLSLQILNIGGNYSQTSGNFTVEANGTSDNQTINLAGNFSLSGGTFCFSSSTSDVITINVAGNWSHTAGTLTETSTGSGNIFFSGTTPQIYTSGGTISNTINYTVNSGAILDVGTSVINGSIGTFTLSTDAGIITANAQGISTSSGTGSIQVTGVKSYSTGANYTYDGTASQSTGNGLPTNLTGSLTINNPNNTVTLSSAESIANGGSINLVAGTFAAGTNLTMNSATSTINRSEGSMTGNIIGTNASTYNVNYTGNSKTTGTELSGGGLNNVTVTLTSGQALTLDQNRTPDGNITINSGSTFDLSTFTFNRSATNGTLIDAGTLILGGTTGGQGNSNFPTNFTTLTMNGGTVSYDNAAGGQTVYSTPAYNNLIMGNNSGTQIAGGNLTVSGALTTTSGGTLNMGTYPLSGTLSTIANGGTIQTQNTTLLPIPTGKNWGVTGTVIFNGSAAQTIPAATFNNLTLNNSAGASLGGAVNVGNTLTLTSGNLTTTPTNLLWVTNTASNAVTGSSASYVKGPLQWSLVNNGSYIFPIGDATPSYHAFELDNITGTNPVIRVIVNSTGATGPDNTSLSAVAGRNWYAQLTGGSITSATVKLTESGLVSTNAVASSLAQTGPYSSQGGNNIGTTITSDPGIPITSSTYFAVGTSIIPAITISDNSPQVTAASIVSGTSNVVLHKSKITCTLKNANLTGMTCPTGGTYVSSDITCLKVWYQTNSTFNAGTATLISTILSPTTAGIKTFPAFIPQVIANGTTGYIFITADIASGATVNNTININALAITDFTFTSATKSVTTTAGGTQTFTASTYYNNGGELQNLSSWGINTDGSGTQPTTFTASNQVFNITNGTSATIGSTWTVSGTNSKVVLGNPSNPAITLTVPSAFSGSTDITSASSGSNTIILQNAMVPTFGTLGSGSTVNYNGSAQTVYPAAYSNLILSGSGTKTVATGTSVTGNLSIITGTIASLNAGVNVQANTITLSGLTGNSGTWGSTASAASFKNNTYFAVSGIVTVANDTRSLTPTITGVTASQPICYGTGTVTLSGTVSAAGPICPADGETVNVTINGSVQPATIAGGVGVFTINYPSTTIPVGSNTITYSYAGGGFLKAAANNTSTSLTVNQPTAISSQSTGTQTKCINGAFPSISVTATGTGTLTYQWYSNAASSNTGGTPIAGATDLTYTPLATTAGTLYYYCVVTGSCGNASSAVSGAFVVNPVTAITANPGTTPQTQCINGTFSALTVTAIGGGLTYQWYSNTTTDNTTGTLIPGAAASGYVPLTTTVGTLYYYCIVTGTCGTSVTSDLSGAFVVNPATAISSQSTDAQTQCINVPFSPISVTATGTGTFTYQWYSNTTATITGGTLITGAVASSYTPSAATAGTLYYYCIVTGTCATATSAVSGAFVVTATTINNQSTATQTQCLNGTFSPISVTATGTGTLTYQWYSNTVSNNTSGTVIGSAVASSYTPPSTSVGTLYYYCMVSGACGSVTSAVSGQFVVNSPTVITANPGTITQTQCISGTFSELSVTATGVSLSYQWYRNAASNNIDGTIIAGATSTSYTPLAATVGTLYYYCIVTGTCGYVTSDVSGAFVVNPATAISSQSTAAQTQCINGAFTDISVAATGMGTLTYQWYSNATANNSNGTLITGANATSYTPLASTAGTLYYYCIVTGTCATANSAVSGAFVVNPITSITGQSTAGQTQLQNGNFAPITVSATGAGLTYQWYRNTTASTTGGTSLLATNGGQTATYTPQSTSLGTLYYYCIINGTCGSVTSDISGAFVVSQVPPSMTTTSSFIGFTNAHGTVTATNPSQQSFTISGTNLIGNITVTAPADFEISQTSGTLFVSTPIINLVPSSGSVPITTIYVRLKVSSAIGTYTAENIDCSTTGVTSKSVAVSGTVTGTTYYSIATGNWNVNTTWSLSSGGGAVAAGIYPVAGDIVNIEGGHNVTATLNAACTTLNFTTATATSLTINTGINLNVSGAITIPRAGSNVNLIAVGAGNLNAGSIAFTSGGTSARHEITISTGIVVVSGDVTQNGSNGSATIAFSGAGTLKLGGAFLNSTNGTLTTVTGSTVVYNAQAAQTVGDFPYFNLTVSGSGIKNLTGVTVNGILSMEGSATASATPSYGGSATLQYNTSTARSAGPEWISPFNATGGIIIANTGLITMNSDEVFGTSAPLTININANFATANHQLTFGGNFVNNGTFTAGSSPIVITNTAATQTISGFTTTGTVSMTKTSGTATLQGNVNGGALTINGNGGTLNLGTGLTHTFSGTWTRTAGTLNGGSSTLRIGGNVSGTSGTFTASTGTVEWYASTAQSAAGVTYNNLTLSGSGLKTIPAYTVSGILSMEGTATVSAAPTFGTNATLQYNTATSKTAGVEWPSPVTASGGIIIKNTGTITMNSAETFNASAPLNITVGASLSTGNNSLTLGGDFTNAGTFTAGSSPIIINGTAPTQNIAGFTTSGAVSMSKTAGIATLTGAVTTTSSLTLSGMINLGMNLSHTANTLTFGSTGQDSGTWGGTGSAATFRNSPYFAPVVTGILTINTSTCTLGLWNGSVSSEWNDPNNWCNEKIPDPSINVTINSGGYQPVIGADAFCNDITIGSGASLTFSTTNTLTVSGNWTNTGTLTGGNGTIAFIGTGKTISGTGTTFNNLTLGTGAGETYTLSSPITLTGNLINQGTLTGTGGVTIAGTAATQSIGGFTTSGTVSISKTAGTATFTGNIGGGGLTLNGLNGTLDLGTNLTHTFTGAWTRTNGTLLGNSSILKIGGSVSGATGSFTPGTGTVEWNGAAQTIAGVGYNNLTLSGSGAKTLTGVSSILGNFTFAGTATATAAAPLTIGGDVTLGAGTTFNGSTFIHNVAGNWTNNGTFTPGTSTINLNGNNSTNINGSSKTNFSTLTINKGNGATTVTSSSKAFSVGSSLTVTQGNLILQATDVNYAITMDLNVLANGTLTHSVDWATGNLLSVGGSIAIDGKFTYTVRSHVQMIGASTTNIRTGSSSLSILTLNTSGTIIASGPVNVDDNFWAFYNITGGTFTIGTNYSVTAKGSMINSGGTININGGILNVTGGLQVGTSGYNGKVILSSGTLNADNVTAGDGTRVGTFAQSGGIANISGNLLINPSFTYTCTNSPIINLGGNWTNNGTFAPATGTVTMNGADQSISGSAAQNFNNLTIGGTGTKTMATAITTTTTGSLTENTGSTFSLGATLTLNGNLFNNGTINGSGAVNIAGGVAQSIGGFTTSGTVSSIKSAGTATLMGTVTAGSFTVNNTGTGMLNLGTLLTHTANTLTLGSIGQPSGSFGGKGSLAAFIIPNYFADATGLLNILTSSCSSGSWTGNTSNDWNTGSNWCDGNVPTSATNVTINNTTNLPIISATAQCNNITINNGASLTVNLSNILTVGGDWTNNGTFNSGSGTVVMIGATNTIGGSSTTTFNNLRLGTGLYTLSSPINLTGDFANQGTTTGGGAVNFTGAIAQSIGAFATTGTVSMTKTGGTATLTGNINGGALTINGTGGTLNLGTGLTHTFSGTWFRTNGTLDGGSSILKLGSGFTGTGGNFNANSGTVEWNRSGDQTIAGLTYNNLTLSGSGNKTISAATSTNGILNLQNNTLLSLGAYNFTLGSSATCTGTFSNTCMIVTNDGGKLQKNMTGIGTATFPVGDVTGGADYSPITLNFTSGTFAAGATVSVKVTNGKQLNNISAANYLNRYWSVSQTGITTFTANVTGTYVPADIVGTENNEVAGVYMGSSIWLRYAPLAFNTLSANGVTALGDFTGLNTVTTLTTSVSTLSGFSYPVGYGPSSQNKFFTITGDALTSNIKVLPTDTFDISLTSGALFAPQSLITLPVNYGLVVTDTIFVRMKAGFGLGVIAPVHAITCSTDNVSTQKVACNGVVTSLPVITVTPGTLNGFTYNVGGTSPAIPFSVSGTNLISTVTITAPTDYKICLTSGGTYVSSLPLTPISGSITATNIYVKLNPGLSMGIFNETIKLTSTNAVTQSVLCNGTVTLPTINLSTFMLGGFIYNFNSGPSGIQSFTVSGANLSAGITLTAPTGFEISNGTYGPTVTLTQTSGIVALTTIYVRLKSGLAIGNYPSTNPNFTVTSTGAISQNLTLTGQVVAAGASTILCSTNVLKKFVYVGNGPSLVQSFTVSGSSLTADISVTCTANFEISLTTGGPYSSTLPIPRTGTLVNAVPVYVRLKAGLGITSYTGTISLASGTATTQNVTCNGLVIAAPTITAGPSGLDKICNASQETLTSTGAGYDNQYWTGPNQLYSVGASLNLGTVTPANNGNYTVTGTVLSGTNLLVNPGFESLNTGFGSSYTYVNPTPGALQPEGVYTVTKLPSSVHSDFINCADHSGSGNQMIINGAKTSNGIIAWSESVNVDPNTVYQFSYWMQTVSAAGNPAQLQFYMNGVQVGPIDTATVNTCQWKQFIFNVNSGSNTVLQFAIINWNTIAGGNDFALDDMVFEQAFQVTSSVNLVVNPQLTPNVSISASSNPLYSGAPVKYIANPTNGGAAPSYQWLVNGSKPAVGGTDQFYSCTPAGNDSIRCVMTSNYPCISGNGIVTSNTLTAIYRANFWMGANGTDWNNSSNWTAGYVPSAGADVEFATNDNNSNQPAASDLVLDQNRTIGSLINATTKQLFIPAGKGLTVNNTITTDNDVNRIYIQSTDGTDGKANGSLIFHNPAELPVYGTVEMYSKAYWDLSQVTGNQYKWQFFGIPLQSVVANPTFYGSYVRIFNEAGTTTSNNYWIQLANTSVLKSFAGYEIVHKDPSTIIFQGKLENGDLQPVPLTYTTGAAYPGQHLFANPYTAAIDISQLNFGAQTEATVYLYNTGSYANWVTCGGGSTPGNSPGQYTSAPKNEAGNNGVPRQVPSMQAMLVKALSNSVDATFGIRYNSVIINNTDLQRVRATKDNALTTKVCTMIDVRGTHYSDRMWIFSEPECTHRFDNGWDGRKLLGLALTPQLYAMEADGNYQVDAVDDMNGTNLGFQAGVDTIYTLTFTQSNTKSKYLGLYLIDKVENKVTDITEDGSTYTFTAKSTSQPANRFTIVTRTTGANSPNNSELKIFSAKSSILVQNFSSLNREVMIYDLAGHCLKHATVGPFGGITMLSRFIPGIYIVKAFTNKESTTQRLIVQ